VSTLISGLFKNREYHAGISYYLLLFHYSSNYVQ
jgi:pentatricopeptide repeat protein